MVTVTMRVSGLHACAQTPLYSQRYCCPCVPEGSWSCAELGTVLARVFLCVFTGSLECAEIIAEFAETESMTMLRLLVMLLMTERACLQVGICFMRLCQCVRGQV